MSVIFFAMYLLVLFWMNRKNPLPMSLNYLSIVHFIGLTIYAYHQYNTIISPFPDSFGYLRILDDMLYGNVGSYAEATNVIGSIQILYPYLNYLVFKILNDHFALYCVNIFISTFSILLLYKVLCVDLSKRVAYATAGFMLVSANVFLFTSHILKDSLVLFLTILAIYLYKVKKRYFLTVTVIALLLMTRIYSGASILVAIYLDVFLFQRKNTDKRTKRIFVAIGLIGGLVEVLVNNAARYATMSVEFVTSNGIFSIIKVVPVALFKMFFSPFAWNMISTPSAYTVLVVDSVLLTVFGVAILFFIRKVQLDAILRKKMSFYLVPLFIHAVALGLAYHGDSARQRIGVFFVIVLVYSVGLFYQTKRSDKANLSNSS